MGFACDLWEGTLDPHRHALNPNMCHTETCAKDCSWENEWEAIAMGVNLHWSLQLSKGRSYVLLLIHKYHPHAVSQFAWKARRVFSLDKMTVHSIWNLPPICVQELDLKRTPLLGVRRQSTAGPSHSSSKCLASSLKTLACTRRSRWHIPFTAHSGPFTDHCRVHLEEQASLRFSNLGMKTLFPFGCSPPLKGSNPLIRIYLFSLI